MDSSEDMSDMLQERNDKLGGRGLDLPRKYVEIGEKQTDYLGMDGITKLKYSLGMG